MDFMEISKMRYTVRRYDKQPVEQVKIDKILEAGRWAPTAVNYQPQRILVLNSPEKLSMVREFCTFNYDSKYADLVKESADMENGKNNYYYGAPLVLFISYDRASCWEHPQSGKSSGVTDATIVATYMMLEASSIGLGTTWVSYFDEAKAKELLGIPVNWQPLCMLYVGYPADEIISGNCVVGKRMPIDKTCFVNQIME